MHADNLAAPGALPKHWLLFRLSSLGDVALTSGPMRRWHEQRGWTFSVLTRPAFAPLFRHNPAVCGVISPTAEELRPPRLFFFMRRLAADCRGLGLLDLHGTARSRLLGLFWQGPVRQAPKFALRRRLFLLRRHPEAAAALRACSVTQRYTLAVEGQAPPARELLPLVYLTPEEKEAARSMLSGLFPAFPDTRPAALHPYAAYSRKTWPPDYWRALTGELERAGLNWFVIGQGPGLFPGDARDLSNRTDLRSLCALLAEAGALISGDSGPLHLAGAVGTPVLALFGPTTAEWGFFPAGPEDLVLERPLPCRPCSLHGRGACGLDGLCLKSIAPAEAAGLLTRLCRRGPVQSAPVNSP